MVELKARRLAQFARMSDASSCTRVDTLRFAIERTGAERMELLFSFSKASPDYPKSRAIVWRRHQAKTAKKAE